MFVNTDLKYIWKNGSYEKWEDSSVHILSHTVHYGTGVFEGVRAYETDAGAAIFRLNDHTERLFDAASKIGIKIPYSIEELNQVQKDIFLKNNLLEGYLRPIVFLGSESLGLRAKDLSVNVAVAAWEWPSYMSPESKKNGIAIIKSSYEQYSNPLHSGYKIIGTYINSTMALHEAIEKGADEALLLDKNGFISEGSGENIFLVNEKTISTPKTDHCLNGITRQSVIQIAKDFGFDVIERDISYDELIASDEVFFSGTAVEITPISKIDETIIGSGSIGPVTEKLQTAYADIVSGRKDQYRNWLSIVSE
ncbi:branched-chain amino acid transaminase [Gammaproteobacteria bacterium]|jgi:branched-chain amino acid aminotransferase|nr:branched-chain amino acid transaminase [Gammaproteobacteria bacterium]MDA9174033.1 branched-chain amino acid transaminase [Gammaproteobacteria bacterium]MDB2447870.1 branched-chain amino acid transaminase [Gammaproteobacteria bacterium]MDB2489700.1 branched-chain amino acid transaminase [Gammaproteobacteria bacterium]MDB2503667.1 branched-chain amino acid transaminase [Gammaproteobacteria bacterium]